MSQRRLKQNIYLRELPCHLLSVINTYKAIADNGERGFPCARAGGHLHIAFVIKGRDESSVQKAIAICKADRFQTSSLRVLSQRDTIRVESLIVWGKHMYNARHFEPSTHQWK